MYTEFVALYVGIGVIVILQIVLLIILILLLKRVGEMRNKGKRIYSASENQIKQGASIVFCSNCGMGFESTEIICPKCGMVR